MKYGLIGFPLTHSFSPEYFSNFFRNSGWNNYSYKPIPIPNQELLVNFFKEEVYKFQGLNVTIPYKEKILPFMHELDISAAEIGAVNVVKVTGRKLIGYNTDGPAFLETLKELALNWSKKSAIVLGSGGASKAVRWTLNRLEMNTLVISRNPTLHQLHWDQITDELCKSCHLLINTTPIGTYPDINQSPPFPKSGFHKQMLVYDLIYNPDPTLFLKNASNQGAKVKSGYDMLVKQAEMSWSIWEQSN